MTYRERRYDASEVRAILVRACEAKDAGQDAPSRSLEEIELLGEELGLSRDAVRRAATGPVAAATAAPRSVGEVLLGGPRRIRSEIVAAGEFDASRHEDVVDRLRSIVREVGRAEVLGDTLTWHAGAQGGRLLTVTIRPVEGGTRIRLDDNLSGVAGGLFGGVGGGAGGGLGGGLAPLLPLLFHLPGWTVPVFVVAMIALALTLARTIFSVVARRRVAEDAQIMDELRAYLERPPARVAVPMRIASATIDEQEDEAERGRANRAGP